jgi:hypothetical protein
VSFKGALGPTTLLVDEDVEAVLSTAETSYAMMLIQSTTCPNSLLTSSVKGKMYAANEMVLGFVAVVEKIGSD